jgi:hypothetical protein
MENPIKDAVIVFCLVTLTIASYTDGTDKEICKTLDKTNSKLDSLIKITNGR